MLKLSQPNISEEAIAAVAEVLRSGQLVHGAESDAFERELADYLGCDEVVLVSSGTAALHIALLALDIGPGDAVIVPDFTFPATANVVSITGARPVIVDVDSETYTLDVKQLEQVVCKWSGPERLRAVIPVHEFGRVADMVEINRIAKAYGLLVVEDAACALGASQAEHKAGTLGDLGCFSFHPRKTLTTGEGGAISTNNPRLAQRLRRLRNHGMERNQDGMNFFEPATNYRLTNFQAALGRAQLPKLDSWISNRTRLASAYLELLKPLQARGLLYLPFQLSGHSWQTFMVVNTSGQPRSQIIHSLRQAGVEANLGAQSLSVLGIYGGSEQTAPCGGNLFREGIALPFCEQYNEVMLETVANSLIQYFAD
jgi:dTDP-4-amino-4,6-dideoxygalactose transaminase